MSSPLSTNKSIYERVFPLAQKWCDRNGYTELHYVEFAPDKLWAFPPGGVMSVPIDFIKIVLSELQ